MPSNDRTLIFSQQEFQRRWTAVEQAIQEHEADVAILHDADTIFYLTGFSGTPTTYQAIVVFPGERPVHVLRYAEESTVAATSYLASGLFWLDHEDPHLTVSNTVREFTRSPKRIAVEKMSQALSIHRFEQLRTQFPDAEFVDVSMPIGDIRQVKSDEEVEMFRRSVAAIEEGMRAGIEATVEGNSERDIAVAISAALLRAGADTSSVGIIASGPRLGEIHGGLSSRKLEPGDVIRLEQSNSVNRYWSRMMRTLSIGEPDAGTRQLHDQLVHAQDAQLAEMKPGAIPEELDAIAREMLPKDVWAMRLSGYGLAFHERSVIGSEIDRFRITKGETRSIQANMVFHVYLTYGNGVSISETVHVTDSGAKRLTTLPRELIVR